MRHKHEEDDHAKALMQWVQTQLSKHPELALLCHIPNGGFRNVREAARFKAQGVKAGVPDYFLDVARGRFHGLRIELKAAKGKVSPAQKDWLAALNRQGYCAVVCYGWEECVKTITAYLRDSIPLPKDKN